MTASVQLDYDFCPCIHNFILIALIFNRSMRFPSVSEHFAMFCVGQHFLKCTKLATVFYHKAYNGQEVVTFLVLGILL